MDHVEAIRHLHQARQNVSVDDIADFLGDETNRQKLKDSLAQAGVPEDQAQGTLGAESVIATVAFSC